MNCSLCLNTAANNREVSYFRFPKNEERCRAWVNNVGLQQLLDKHGALSLYKSHRICSDHFDPASYLFDGRKVRLFPNAIPDSSNPNDRVVSKRKDCIPSQKSYSAKLDNRDSIINQQLAQQLCRVCAEENFTLMEIYGATVKELDLENKLKILPIQITPNDVLPLRVCGSCIYKVNSFHNFLNNCIKADIKLKTILDIIIDPPNEQNNKFAPSNNYMEVITNVISGPTITENRLPEEALVNLNWEENVSDVNITVIAGNENEQFSKTPTIPEYLPRVVFNNKHLDAYINSKVTVSQDENLHMVDHDYVQNEIFIKPGINEKQHLKKVILKSNEFPKIVSSFSCEHCLKRFPTEIILDAHKRAHTLQPNSNNEFECENCGQVYKNRYRLNEHLRKHSGELPYHCSNCKSKFHKFALLKQHMMTHSSEKHFQCYICGKRTNRRGNIISHVKKHYKYEQMKAQGLPVRGTQCTMCRKPLNSVRPTDTGDITLQQVFCEFCQSNDTGDEISLQCKSCLIICDSSDELKRHITSAHTQQKIYDSRDEFASVLPKPSESTTKSTDAQAVQCKICLKTFRSKQLLNLHSDVHSEERSFSCSKCSKKFKRHSSLKIHDRIHTGERPFKCSFCGFHFKQRGDCKKHEKNHIKKGDLPETTTLPVLNNSIVFSTDS